MFLQTHGRQRQKLVTLALKSRRTASYGRIPSQRRTLLTQSYVQGPTDPPLDKRTFTRYYEEELLRKYPEHPALVCRSERAVRGVYGRPRSANSDTDLGRTDCLAWSFAELHEHVDALAIGLRRMVVRPGDRVGVVMGNNSAYAALQWAVARAGAILVTINPAYRIHELIATIKLVGVHTLVLVPSIRTSHYLTALFESIPALHSCAPGSIAVEELSALRNILLVDDISSKKDDAILEPSAGGVDSRYRTLLEGARCAVDFREAFAWTPSSTEKLDLDKIKQNARPDDVVNLQFTSGTTGYPKAVSLTHTNLLNNALSIGRCMQLRPDDVLCNVPPLFHCFGLVLGNLAAWVYGSCIVYASPIFSPRAIVDAVLDERCSALHGVPTHFLGVLTEVARRRAEGEELKFERLRTGIAAGAPVPIELMRRLIDEMGLVGLTNAYGMTETSPVSFQTTPADPLEARTETVGRVQPHVRAKLLGPPDSTKGGQRSVVPVGVPGEICVAGYLLQKGYWEDEEQTRSVMRTHGTLDADPDEKDKETIWMHTGDIGILDEEGYLRVVGRSKDVIIRGGENLFPVQIENRLAFHPRVREAAVVAVPDTKYGEVVGAFVVIEDEAAKIEANVEASASTVDSKVGMEKANNREEDVDAETRASELVEAAADDEPLTGLALRAWVAREMNPQNAPTWVWFIPGDAQPAKGTGSPNLKAPGPTQREKAPENEEAVLLSPEAVLAAPLPRTASGKVQKHLLRARARVLSEAGIGEVRTS